MIYNSSFASAFPDRIDLSMASWGPILSKLTELAARKPEPATAGTPIPGKQLSPHTSKFFNGVLGKGNEPSPALMAGP